MTYVQDSVDRLKILPQLAHGARCVVLDCIGLFEADPLGASKRDILDYTGLSRPTVESALRFLEVSELITFDPASKRYRASKYYRCDPGHQQDVRELVPMIQGERTAECKKVFDNASCMYGTLNDTESILSFNGNIHKHESETRAIFSECGVEGPNLDRLSEKVQDVALAGRWLDWKKTNPKGFTRPGGYIFSQLSKNPRAEPPGVYKKIERKREPHFQGLLIERWQSEVKSRGNTDE